IYQGDQWPAEWCGKALTLNLHGRRINVERLERRGSGYVAKHEPDFLSVADPWFRGVDLLQAPDGGVFIADWSDAGECHENDGVHRTSGRIYKISSAGGSSNSTTDPLEELGALDKLLDQKLGELQLSRNEWLVRTARRVLQERAASGRRLKDVHEQLRAYAAEQTGPAQKLRALWALHVSNGAGSAWLREQLGSGDEQLRAWSVRLATERWISEFKGPELAAGENSATELPEEQRKTFAQLLRLAGQDPSPLVRLVLASTLQRMPDSFAHALAQRLVARAEDRDDRNIPLLLWYGIQRLEPDWHRNEDALKGLDVHTAGAVRDSRIPILRRFVARQLAENIEHPFAARQLSESLNLEASQEDQLQIVTGMLEGVRGRRKAARPAGWDAFAGALRESTDPAIREHVRSLSVVFGDGQALEEVLRIALDGNASFATRRQAVRS
ncbi:MAG: hypothetical protein M3463_04835, partial [Verrucomicrobiota bacterium]|nr:hypothetical protein [Verrucomicrobiota bacterium]